MDEIRLSIAVMHHPARPELERRVLDAILAGDLPAHLHAEVVVDPEPFGPTNPWRTAREAWRRTPDDCTHRLVIQDDAIVCGDFALAAEHVLGCQPRVAVSFFCNWLGHQIARAQMDACARCRAFAELPRYGWYPTVATALPAADARDLGAFQISQRQIADDAVFAAWALKRRRRVLQTVPSLVDHDETVLSTVSQHASIQRRHGKGRGAACPIGETDWREIDWTRGP